MSTVTCPTLVNPTDGTVTMSGNIEGSTATYSCNTGFGVNGAEMVTCTSDGSWSADPPTCDCELMVTVLNPLLVSLSLCVCVVQLCVLDCLSTMEWSCTVHQVFCLRIQWPPTPVPQLPMPWSVMLPGPVSLMETGAPLLPLVQVSKSTSLDWLVTLIMLKKFTSLCNYFLQLPVLRSPTPME